MTYLDENVEQKDSSMYHGIQHKNFLVFAQQYILKLQLSAIVIILLQKFISIFFCSSADAYRTQGSAGFCSLVAIFHDLVHPTFANVWQSCHIPALLPIFFSVFLFLSHQLLNVVLLLDPFLHPFSQHAPTIATFTVSETLPIFLHPSLTNLFVVDFIFQGFSTYHSQHSHSAVFDFFLSSTFTAQHSAP